MEATANCFPAEPLPVHRSSLSCGGILSNKRFQTSYIQGTAYLLFAADTQFSIKFGEG